MSSMKEEYKKRLIKFFSNMENTSQEVTPEIVAETTFGILEPILDMIECLGRLEEELVQIRINTRNTAENTLRK